jgi:hypothetical protein
MEDNLMTSLTNDFLNLVQVRRRLWGGNRLLTLSAIIYFALFLATIAATLLDARVVTGAPVWIKPMKFALSSLLYTGTLAWILSYVNGRSRLVKFLAGGITLALLAEVGLIVIQAARGVRSHFNFATTFDERIFNLMGMLIMIVWVLHLVTAVLLLRQRLEDGPFAWGIRLGLLITLVGAALGFSMIPPNSEQMAGLQAGEKASFIGAHSVGVEDGGPGLPVTGWSIEGGDLRVAHFAGLHALQLLPLAAIFINRSFGRLNERRRKALVLTAGLGYLGLVALLFWQALRGQPLIAPDAATLAVLAALMTVVIVATATLILGQRQKAAGLNPLVSSNS